MTLSLLQEDTWGNRICWVVIKTRVRIGRGQGIVNYVKDIASVSVLVFIIEQLLRRFGFENQFLFNYLYILTPVAYFGFSYGIGYYLENYQKMEAIYNTKHLNPFMDGIDEKVTNTNELAKQINDKLDELKSR